MNPLEFSGFPSQQAQDPPNNDDDLSSGFLKDVDEADRAILEKYLPKWNGQVTQRFQAIHGQYEPYKRIGMDPDTLSTAAWIYSQLDSDPVGMYKKIHKALKESDMWEDPDDDGQQPVGGSQASLPEFEGVPEQFVRQFQQMQEELGQLRETTQGFIGSQQEREEMAMLDQVLNEMHTHFGDFDEEWILTRLARGKNPSEAFQEYQQFVQGITGANNRQRKPAPNVFGGSGSVPAGQVDRSKMNTPEGRKNFIAAALEAAQS